MRTRPERAFNVGAALGLLLAAAAAIFLVQNSGATDFEWLWFDFELPLWIALVGALAVGALLVPTAFAVHHLRRRRIARRERAAGRIEAALTDPG
ncbi:MAG TPA: lipopolysaccharide assembly protein LapA domain-containing protein, partial [Acidimicrobiales bacterium]|nr:lipopolysaccharide assembly protein LapA domain-containing protein [Acidimicrobiales bacterium]